MTCVELANESTYIVVSEYEFMKLNAENTEENY